MKIAVIGATGTVGKAVVAQLASRHEIIEVGNRSGQYQVDMTDIRSVEALFGKIGKVDAVVSTAGKLHFGPLQELTPEKFGIGLRDKLMGQINLALVAQHHLNDGGSITLTSGILSDEPILQGVNASTVNAALDGFVRAAAIELKRGIRINVVSPTVLEESLASYGPFFYGFQAAPASRVAQAYSRSVEGAQTGRVYKVWQ
ncbi:NAD(P)-dependent dehydrogenase, short-chain alcohol dehydrogenase family [Collimonas sp. OK242]|jgi:NAD(P)-dependent dehydrogenase (short-subunit alcohol dehydrogenase family)|uniref:short chain dehydrogenase n=1 Tax=Collimonas sp. OK242 TaxID=1798195 RepID=UPI0008981B10|nr:short chain dehydrogenase [Collimonas sp. OK242]SDX15055.1 NAD(P)-dependent dehydrogenase, short-chain alcohol dehydrogenase family [Collimonas sp. OK242]